MRWLSKPAVSIILRNIIELNFHTQRKLITQYLLPLSAVDRVIDIGCGSGEFSALFPPAQYIGVDIDEASLVYAREKFKRKFLKADATQLPFPDGLFSHVLVVGVLHHMNDSDALRVLQEIRRVLAPEGRALIMEDTVSARLLARMVHAVDQGKFIRTFEAWHGLIGGYFKIENNQ